VGDATGVFDDDGEAEGEAVSLVVHAVAPTVISAAEVSARSAFVLFVMVSINSVESRPLIRRGF
jgi:hypothetical protein